MKLSLVYRSTKPKGQISIKLRHYKKDVTNGEIQLHYKTNFLITKKDFQNKTFDLDAKYSLDRCFNFIQDAFFERGSYFKPTKDWFHKRCDEFFNISEETDTLLLDWVNKKIKDLKNSNASSNTISNYKGLSEKIKRYNSHLELYDLNLQELEKLKSFLREDLKYGINTVNKDIDHIKNVLNTACRIVDFSDDFRYWNKFKQSKSSKFKLNKVIVIEESEIEQIKELELQQEHLINARKWLLIGINTAQRGNELLSINVDNFKYDEDNILVIDFSQNKVGQVNRIPALSDVKNFYDSNELPYKISDNKLNKHIKTLGEMAGINIEIESDLSEVVEININGKKTLERRNVRALRPKYAYFQTRMFRRTFCSYWIDKMPPEEIRKITGHQTNEMLFTYVAEARPDFTKWKKHI